MLNDRPRAANLQIKTFCLWVAVQVLLLGLVAWFSWSARRATGWENKPRPALQASPPALVVVPAVVTSGRSAKATAPFAGLVRRLLVRPGQRVRRGDLLFELDATDLRHRLTRAQQAAVGTSTNGARALAPSLEHGWARARRLAELIRRARQVSTMDGMVSEVRSRAGAWVPAGTPMARVDDPRQFEVVTLVRADARPRLKPGTHLTINADQSQGGAKVIDLVPGTGRTLFCSWVFIRPLKPGALRGGQQVEVSLPRGTSPAPMVLVANDSTGS